MNKELKKYVTDELLLIANNVTGEYTDKQVQQAKLELYNRGVDDKIIADIMEEKEAVRTYEQRTTTRYQVSEISAFYSYYW